MGESLREGVTRKSNFKIKKGDLKKWANDSNPEEKPNFISYEQGVFWTNTSMIHQQWTNLVLVIHKLFEHDSSNQYQGFSACDQLMEILHFLMIQKRNQKIKSITRFMFHSDH